MAATPFDAASPGGLTSGVAIIFTCRGSGVRGVCGCVCVCTRTRLAYLTSSRNTIWRRVLGRTDQWSGDCFHVLVNMRLSQDRKCRWLCVFRCCTLVRIIGKPTKKKKSKAKRINVAPFFVQCVCPPYSSTTANHSPRATSSLRQSPRPAPSFLPSPPSKKDADTNDRRLHSACTALLSPPYPPPEALSSRRYLLTRHHSRLRR